MQLPPCGVIPPFSEVMKVPHQPNSDYTLRVTRSGREQLGRPIGFLDVRNSRGTECLELHKIFSKQQIESPVQSDAKLFLEPRKFAEINRSPHPPGNEAGEVNAQNVCDSRAPANGRQLTNCRERKSFQSSTANAGD